MRAGRHHKLNGHEFEQTLGDSEGQGRPGVLQLMRSQRVGHALVTERQVEPMLDAFELWCWRRLLRVLWTARRSNQSILKEVNPGYSLGGLILMLKLQYFGHLIQRADSLEKILMLGKIKSKRKRG